MMEEEVNGHSVIIDKLVKEGRKMLDSSSFASSTEVVESTEALRDAFDDLLATIGNGGDRLQPQLGSHRSCFEYFEVESWMGKRKQALQSTNCDKLLTRHRVMELGIDACSGTIHNSSTAADSGTIKARSRQDGLVRSIQLYECLLESSEVGTWMGQRVSTAGSRNPGTDCERLEVLLVRYQDFKMKVLASEEVANSGHSMVDSTEEGHNGPNNALQWQHLYGKIDVDGDVLCIK